MKAVNEFENSSPECGLNDSSQLSVGDERNHAMDLSKTPEVRALVEKYKQLEKPNEKYFWKWRVSTEDYEEFRDLLLKVNFADRTREKVRLCAHQLSFYIAEWYKREYDGFDSANCLESINIPSASFNKDIWEYSHDIDDRPYCTEDTHINEWLYSMYVMGGFPIKYTKRAAKFAPLFDNIWGDDQKTDVISEEQLNELTQGFDGNQVIKNALISGSLHEYYRYLRIQESMPIAESDMDKEPFADFIRNLQEGKKKYYEQYIKPVWYMYLDPRDNIIEGTVKVSFGKKGDNCYIPFECLQYWHIPNLNSLLEFDIEVSDTASDVKRSVHFSKTGPGNYPFVGWSRENAISLQILPDKNSEICVNLVDGAIRHQIYEPFSMGDSRQFYKTKKPYEWCSKTDNSAHTAVLYNPVKLKISNESSLSPEDCPREKIFEEDGQVWMWMPLSDKIIICSDTGVSYAYAPYNNSLEFSFKTKKEVIKYTNFRDIIYCQRVDDEFVQTSVPLLFKRGLSILYTPYGNKSPMWLEKDDYTLYYKRIGETRFAKWDDGVNVNQGLLSIKAVYNKNGASATKLVYYIPHTDPIRRVTENNSIVFGRGITDIYAPGQNGYEPVCADVDGIIRYNDDIIGGYLPQSDTIPFRIGQPDDKYVEINVYRSCICKELYLNTLSEPIKRYDGSRGTVEIPFFLRKNFEVRTIDDKGVSRSKCGDDLYMRFDQNETIVDNVNGFKYYITTDRYIQKTPNPKEVSIQLETGPSEYRFYYWSMNVGEDPVLLEQDYDMENKILTVNTSYLAKNKSGIVFQSLKGVSPRHYIQPVYGTKRAPRCEVKCFEVASEHEIPFQLFPCLTEIFSTSRNSFDFENLSRFWADLMLRRLWRPSGKDLRNLHRFASEFLFDWILIPKRFWRSKMLRNDYLRDKFDIDISMKTPLCRDVMTKLFRSSPYLQKENKEYFERVLEIYWNAEFLNWQFNKNQKIENLFLQCLRGFFTSKGKSDYSCLHQDLDVRMKYLKEFHNCSTLYEKVYRLMIQLNK